MLWFILLLFYRVTFSICLELAASGLLCSLTQGWYHLSRMVSPFDEYHKNFWLNFKQEKVKSDLGSSISPQVGVILALQCSLWLVIYLGRDTHAQTPAPTAAHLLDSRKPCRISPHIA